MYLWKCWRDTRSVFRGFVGALFAVAIFGLYVRFDPLGWIAAKPESSRLWQLTSDALGTSLGEMILVAGFMLGALGVGVEFERGTADFLLTRPRSRRSFLWTSWSLGAIEMLTLILLAHAVTWLTGPKFYAYPGFFSRQPLAECTVGLLIYNLTYLMTTIARNSRNGTGLSLAALTIYTGLQAWLEFWYGTTIPLFWDLFDARQMKAGGWFGSVLGWLAVSVALMVIAQFRFERVDA
jgi:ABC-type transport system involved in multi-copper enzyme maturation permease subunit